MDNLAATRFSPRKLGKKMNNSPMVRPAQDLKSDGNQRIDYDVLSTYDTSLPIKHLESELLELGSANNKLKHENELLSSRLLYLESCIEENREILCNRDDAMRQLKLDVSNLELENAELHREIEKLSCERREPATESEKRMLQRENNLLRKLVDDVEMSLGSIHNLNNHISTVSKSKYDSLVSDYSSLKSEFAKLELKLAEQSHAIDDPPDDHYVSFSSAEQSNKGVSFVARKDSGKVKNQACCQGTQTEQPTLAVHNDRRSIILDSVDPIQNFDILSRQVSDEPLFAIGDERIPSIRISPASSASQNMEHEMNQNEENEEERDIVSPTWNIRSNIDNWSQSSKKVSSSSFLILPAFSQMMRGGWMKKFPRKAFSKLEIKTLDTGKFHKRFFWINPFTSTLFWAKDDTSKTKATKHGK